MATRAVVRPRPKLDRSTVIDRAFAVSDELGLDAVTIRRLAQDLSVSPMALYWHVADKDALLGAMADRMWAETEETLAGLLAEPGDDHDGWRQLRLTTQALVEVLRRHPSVARLVPVRAMASDAGLAVTERTLGFLAGKGFDPATAADVARYVLISAIMLVSELPGGEDYGIADIDEHRRAKLAALAALPEDRYPHVRAAAGFLMDCANPDTYFARGIDLVVAGVRALAPAAG